MTTNNILTTLLREPAEVYHARSEMYLTAHALHDFRRCPLMYRKKEIGLVEERDTAAYLVGRAAHTLILEGRQRYEREYAIGGPINPKTGQPFGSQTKAFAEWAEKQNRPVLSDSQAALVENMAAAVAQHPIAPKLFSVGVAEGVVRTLYMDIPCQARIDWVNPNDGIVDLKTCDHLDDFEAAIRAFGYLYQLSFYRELLRGVSGLTEPVRIVAVEKREPFRVGVWLVAPEVLDAAKADNESHMLALRRCRQTGNWFTRYEEERLISSL